MARKKGLVVRSLLRVPEGLICRACGCEFRVSDVAEALRELPKIPDIRVGYLATYLEENRDWVNTNTPDGCTVVVLNESIPPLWVILCDHCGNSMLYGLQGALDFPVVFDDDFGPAVQFATPYLVGDTL